MLEAVGEMIDVARRSGAPLHLSHLKSLAGDELVEPLLELIDAASAELDVTFDQYPYGAGATLLASLLPAWAQAGGAEATLARARRPEQRARDRARRRATACPGWENHARHARPGADRRRRRVARRARRADARPVDTVATCCVESRARGADGPPLRDRRGGAHDRRATACSSSAPTASSATTRTRASTARRRASSAASRSARACSPVEEAVARLTARAADRLGLADRGRIEPGKRADLVLLDPERYVDTATYDDPKRSPAGVRGVWVAGERVVATARRRARARAASCA